MNNTIVEFNNWIYEDTFNINGNRFGFDLYKEDEDSHPEIVINVLGLGPIDIVKTFDNVQEAIEWMYQFNLKKYLKGK